MVLLWGARHAPQSNTINNDEGCSVPGVFGWLCWLVKHADVKNGSRKMGPALWSWTLWGIVPSLILSKWKRPGTFNAVGAMDNVHGTNSECPWHQQRSCSWSNGHRGGLRILSQHQHQLFQPFRLRKTVSLMVTGRIMEEYILARDRGCRGVHTSHCLNIAVAVTKVECTFFDESWSWLKTHRSWQYSRPIRRYDHYCPVGCNQSSCKCFLTIHFWMCFWHDCPR